MAFSKRIPQFVLPYTNEKLLVRIYLYLKKNYNKIKIKKNTLSYTHFQLITFPSFEPDA